MRKKVLFVINTMGRAGAETAMLELLRQFDPAKYHLSLYVLLNQGELIHELPEHVKLLNPRYNDRSVLDDQGRKDLLRYTLGRMFKRLSLFKNIGYLISNLYTMLRQGKIQKDKLLWKILSDGADYFEEEYDMAVAYLEGGATYYVADHVKARVKVAFVHTDYGMAGYTPSLDHQCYQKMDRIFTVSDEGKTAFLKIYPELCDRLFVFHNLINKERIIDKSQQEGGFTDNYQGFRILTVGRLTVPKAFDVSIHAMRLLKNQGIDARWYVLGEGDQREILEKLISELGLEEDFLLLGNKANPYPYYKQADLYVHASRYEGKSIAIQEAQILGCPILVSDCSGNREQVTDGLDGVLCEFRAQSICDHILKLLHNEDMRTQYGQAAAHKVHVNKEEMEQLFKLMETGGK